MYTSPVSQAQSAANSNSSAKTPSANDQTQAFLSLLVTELKAQDPTSPLDPNQMTQQIVSLNQLDQLIQIHSILQGAGTKPAS